MRQVPHSKITLLTSIGAGLEYYDYVIYYLLANYISQQFFPTSNHTATLFATFSLFAISNVIRPLGGVFVGMLGDHYGRKNVFANTLLCMALASFCIGILPSFAAIGILATILFCALRILQGITFGAELPGAITFLLEHIRTKNRGLHCGFLISAVSLGVTLGSGINYLLTKFFDGTAMLLWGFRIPFILGGLLAIIGFFIRKKIAETPLFLTLNPKRNNSLKEISKKHFAQIFAGIGMVIFPATLVTYLLAFPVYLHEIFYYQFPDIYLATTLGYLWCAVLIPIFGGLADHLGRKALFMIALLLVIFFGPWIFGLLNYGTVGALFIFMGLWQIILAMLAACYFVLLPEAFPTEVRFTATAFSYNVAYTFAAFFPLIANYIYHTLHKPQFLSWIFSAIAVLSLGSVLFLKNYTSELEHHAK